MAWELPEEVIENAGEGPAQVDLRAIETRNAMSRLMNAYEVQVAAAVSLIAAYEPADRHRAWSWLTLPGVLYQADAAARGMATGPADWADATVQPDHRRPDLEARRR